ncbi:ATP-binding protein [Staphylococcus aureus]
MFDDPKIANAILDRILHHSSVVKITGKSYRLKNHSPKKKIYLANNFVHFYTIIYVDFNIYIHIQLNVDDSQTTDIINLSIDFRWHFIMRSIVLIAKKQILEHLS